MADKQESASRSEREDFVYLVQATSGDYEPSYWTVCAFSTEAEAAAEVERMNEKAGAFWDERRELGEPAETAHLSDDDATKVFDEFDAKRDALLKKWRAQIGDEGVDIWDRPIYSVGTVKMRGIVRSERGLWLMVSESQPPIDGQWFEGTWVTATGKRVVSKLRYFAHGQCFRQENTCHAVPDFWRPLPAERPD